MSAVAGAGRCRGRGGAVLDPGSRRRRVSAVRAAEDPAAGSISTAGSQDLAASRHSRRCPCRRRLGARAAAVRAHLTLRPGPTASGAAPRPSRRSVSACTGSRHRVADRWCLFESITGSGRARYIERASSSLVSIRLPEGRVKATAATAVNAARPRPRLVARSTVGAADPAGDATIQRSAARSPRARTIGAHIKS